MPNHPSSIRLTFDPDGAAIVLLDFGDEIADDLVSSVEQQSASFIADGATWGIPMALGGAMQSHSWSRRLTHDSRAAALTYSRSVGLLLPLHVTAPLLEEVQDGATFLHEAFALLAAPTHPHPLAAFDTITDYRGISGVSRPIAGIPLAPGLPWSWLLTPWEDIDVTWESL